MSSRVVQLLALAGCVAAIASSTRLIPRIQEHRRELNQIGAPRVEENIPPEYAFFIQAFGAFRGYLTNYLFIRAETLKEEGRYYDALQLARMICALQPRFPSVWEFQAWNMAWNISVTTYTPEERWNWVYNGVRLLRDQGLKYNPGAINLYKQLAWIFVNKMSETTDEHHMAYKRNWAWRMHLLFGPPPDPLGEFRPDQPFQPPRIAIGEDELAAAIRESRRRRDAERAAAAGRTLPAEREPAAPGGPEAARPAESARPDPGAVARKAAYERIRSVADAPRKLADLYTAAPETREMVERLRALGVRIDDEALDEDAYWNSQGLSRTFFARWRRLADAPALRARVVRPDAGVKGDGAGDELSQFDAIVGVTDRRPAGAELLRFLQRKVLTEVYKLDPAEMASLVETFGPMDWRVVDAHSLYWVNRALIAGKETISSFRNDKTNTARMIFFSLRNLFHRNRLTFEPDYADLNRSYINFSPDLNFIEPMHQAYLTYGPIIDPAPGTAAAGETFRSGHVNFLMESVRMLYFYGREREAARYYAFLQDHYGRQPDGSINPNYNKTLRDFVVDGLLDADLAQKDVQPAINGFIFSALTALASGDFAPYTAMLTQARAFHTAFHQGDSPLGVAEKLRMPPFQEMVADMVRLWLSQPAVNQETMLAKARLWFQLGGSPELQQAVYDDLIESLTRECDAWGLDAARAFPEPPDMADYRQRAGRRGPDVREKSFETPAQQLK